MKNTIAALALCVATAAHAHVGVMCNSHGAVVTLDDGTVFYLGKDCDAARKGGGSGRWYLAASAFVVEIGGRPMRLPFEVDCDLPACWHNS